MNDLIETTWKTVPELLAAARQQTGAMLVHLYPPGPSLGSCHPLGDGTVTLGRMPGCDIQAAHVSVSRGHAHIECGTDGYYITDLESTNGTYINDTRVDRQKLADGDRLRLGSVIYRFLTGSNVEAQYHAELHRLTTIDALTEIPNKRYLLECLERELAQTARHLRPLAVAVFDVDHFKQVNDRWGHLAGDTVLRDLAALVKPALRKSDLFARFGGEEFVVVLPETSREQGALLAERLRGLVERHGFLLGDAPRQITISVGVAATAGEVALTPQELLQEADARLYQAKASGRNRVVT
jgi:diguanylate cyclase (GGDEF)-like protein